MPTESFGVFQSFKAAADYSAKQYYLMYLSADHTVTICGAAGTAIGILYNKPNINQYGQVLTACGVLAKVIAGAAVNIGNILESDSSGRAVAFTFANNGATSTYSIGRAVTACNNAGEYITVLTNFCPAGK